MGRRQMGAALMGAAAGAALVVVALPLEIAARGLPLRGGLLEVQAGSVAIWIVETMPFLLAAAMYAVSSRKEVVIEQRIAVPVPVAAPPPPPVAAPPPPPAPSASAIAPPPPPPLPAALTGAQVLGVNQPDTRVQAMQELLKTVREQAERAEKESRSKSRTVAQMAYELRTPLAAIIGHAELLEEDGADLGSERLQEIRKVVRSARHLSGLVSDILDLSKLEIGALAMVLQDVDLAQVLDEVRVQALPLAERHANRYVSRVSQGARFARGDHGRVRQVVLGLLSNAFRVTRSGTVSVAVEMAPEEGPGWVAIRVKDTGTGLGEQELEHLFDGTNPAVGLGVTIGRRLTELMGGRIAVESESGRGTTFSVLLPPATKREADAMPRSTIALNERLAGMYLLIVDGEPGGVPLMRYMERAGMVVRLVSDVQSAKLAADVDPIQLVILDVGLPGAWSLAEDLIAARVRVVATSLRDEDVEEALQLGVTAFLVRPVERKLVLATLERCIEDV
ncbi:MAG: hypothetical protein H6738_08340 [Alphaproteobacteria bacterium]|nr:hypothetical protein [Alphaproteobacteria bacterium]MCB9696769.1 hypothetical protein [Alphaproteobacteria bacterium]